MAQRAKSANRVYRANAQMGSKTCSNCGQKIGPGRTVKYSKDSIQRGSALQHAVCPQRAVTVRYAEVT